MLRKADSSRPFLLVPPFPRATTTHFLERADCSILPDNIADDVRRLRVGGTYWAAQPDLPADFVLVRRAVPIDVARQLARGRPIVHWLASRGHAEFSAGVQVIHGECDPWHMLSSAASVVLEPNDELRVIAALIGVQAHLFDAETGNVTTETSDAAELLAAALPACSLENPFTGHPMTVAEAIELCGFWRQLIDSNRDIAAGLGFAFWKQDHVAPLLWNGCEPVRFVRTAEEVPAGAPVALWRAKVAPDAATSLERAGSPLIEVEDGFLRSRGLGADCIPPLSITVDRCGAHFDPARPSELERLIQNGPFDASSISRAAELRRLVVEGGIGKYEQGSVDLRRPAGTRRHILVPGQVEDDRAVQAGGCGLVSNLELLNRVREQAPDAYILYKPHPDVVAGHRRGAVPNRLCLEYADEICGQTAIASLISMVDEVHVNTSLAGFEALMREKGVTTYGVPFYAGWGLTRDLGPVPARRTARRSLDELVAATLLMYPRYLDPVSGLPCPAEIIVARLSSDEDRGLGLLVGMRRLQGKVMRRLRSLVQ